MIYNNYENFTSIAPTFPISYHTESMVMDRNACTPLHWHEHIEILLVKEGSMTIYINNVPLTAQKGDLIIINSGLLHEIPQRAPHVVYQCLIPHKSFCDRFFLPLEDLNLQPLVHDPEASSLFTKIMEELIQKPLYYRANTLSLTLSLLVLLVRKYPLTEIPHASLAHSSKNTITKEIISYLMQHVDEPLSIQQLCEHVGFSKHYICHSFKEITGYTIIEYLNILRCNNAKNLLLTGQYSISQCAEKSGFHNLSYFTRTYQKYMQELPSDTRKKSDKKQQNHIETENIHPD